MSPLSWAPQANRNDRFGMKQRDSRNDLDSVFPNAEGVTRFVVSETQRKTKSAKDFQRGHPQLSCRTLFPGSSAFESRGGI